MTIFVICYCCVEPKKAVSDDGMRTAFSTKVGKKNTIPGATSTVPFYLDCNPLVYHVVESQES
jgi:hypothetical protein